MASPRHHRPDRKRTKQGETMMREEQIPLKDLLTIARNKYNYPDPHKRDMTFKYRVQHITQEYLKQEKQKGKTLKQIAAENNVKPTSLNGYLKRKGISWRQL